MVPHEPITARSGSWTNSLEAIQSLSRAWLPPAPKVNAGERFGPYRLIRELGAGGMGRVGLSVGARLSTAPNPDVPNSPYIDLGDGFRQMRFAMDRLYVRWQPMIDEERPLTLWAGKFPNPLRQPAHFSELVWDADIHPEGVAATFEPVPQLRLTAGGFLLLTRGNASDVNVGAVQAAVRLDPAPDWQVDAALGGYFFGEIDASAAAVLAGQNRGNDLLRDAGGEVTGFASGFDIWQAHGQVLFDGLSLPLALGGEYMTNASAISGSDGSGFALSGRVGAFSGVGSYVLEYRYQDVGQESIFSSLAQDDFLDATGFRGHMAGLGVQLTSFARVRGWTLWSKAPDEGRLQRRYRVDLDFSWRAP